jgi:RNA recognition motif-containing protein
MTTKVFVGNLAFQMTDQALAEAFTQSGQVKSGVIITRGRRSLGYGFVDFLSAEDAARAVESMNKSELFGRQIKVELVRDPSERPPPRTRPPLTRGTQSGGGGNPPLSGPTSPSVNNNQNPNVNQSYQAASAAVHPADNQGEDVDGEPAERRKPRRPNPRGRGRRRGASGRIPGGGGGSPNNNNINQSGGGLPPPPYNSELLQNTEGGGEGPRRPPRNRNRNRRNIPYENNRPPQERILSKTAVFVANLPFSIDDEQLAKIFDGFQVKSAHVVRTRTQRSRGYGFVEFESENDQVNAINSKNAAQVEGANGTARPISVTASHSVPPPPKEVGVGGVLPPQQPGGLNV